MASAVESILATLGINTDSVDAKELVAKLSAAAKAEMSEAADKLKEKKIGNYKAVENLAAELRETICDAAVAADLLPGSVLNFTVRVEESGVFATANNCASKGTMERIHVTKSGAVVKGEEGAEAAKNKRFRAKN